MGKDRVKKPDVKDDDRKTLGERLREAREYLGFSQEEVATYLGVSRSALSNMESGQRKVDALELKKLAGLYKRPVSHFTGDEAQHPTYGEDIALESIDLRSFAAGRLGAHASGGRGAMPWPA